MGIQHYTILIPIKNTIQIKNTQPLWDSVVQQNSYLNDLGIYVIEHAGFGGEMAIRWKIKCSPKQLTLVLLQTGGFVEKP